MAVSAASSRVISSPSLHPPSSLSRRLLLPAVTTLPRLPLRGRLVVVASQHGGVGAKPTVLVAEKLGEAGLGLLKEFANVDCSYNLSPEELCTKISLCDALIVRSGTKVGREVFESSGGRLRVVGRAGVGIDNVDLAAGARELPELGKTRLQGRTFGGSCRKTEEARKEAGRCFGDHWAITAAAGIRPLMQGR